MSWGLAAAVAICLEAKPCTWHTTADLARRLACTQTDVVEALKLLKRDAMDGLSFHFEDAALTSAGVFINADGIPPLCV